MDLLCHEPPRVPTSYKDPVLLNDDRVLQNLLATEDRYLPSGNYFDVIQQDIKPHMRKLVSKWMLEVLNITACKQGGGICGKPFEIS